MKKSLLVVALLCICTLFANAGSGIFIRGGLNGWAADPAWEFTEQADGSYVLENKTLFGAFKVADANWSLVNYGATTGAPQLGQPYNLGLGSMTNIDLGDATYNCTKITLTIDADAKATLLLEGTKAGAEEITCVYVIGDNNNWNFNDGSGKLSATTVKNEFAGEVEFKLAFENTLAYWRIYEGLGQKGTWGTTTGENLTEDTKSGTLKKGSEGCVTTAAGKYNVTFNLETGAFTLTEVAGGVEDPGQENVSVTAHDGQIVVEGTDDVTVYAVSGALVSKNAANIAVPAGLYIVKAGNKVEKVNVK